MTADEHLHALAVELNRWLGDKTFTDIAPVLEVLSLPVSQWRALFHSWPMDARMPLTRALVDRAYELQHRSPKDALHVARLATRTANFISGRSDDLPMALELEGDAWREHARALMYTGYYEEAMRSADQAAYRYRISFNDAGETSPSLDDNDTNRSVMVDVLRELLLGSSTPIPAPKQQVLEKATRLELVVGEIMHLQGRSDEGLSTIARSCDLLLYCFNEKEMYVKGRLLYGKILIQRKRFIEAVAVFDETFVVAVEIEYLEGQAHLVNNLGVCYYYLGDFDKAKPCAETAMQYFEQLRKPIAAIRPRTLLVLLLMEQGKANKTLYNKAAAELFKTRAAWLEVGMRREAALVMVDIIRALILAGRQQHINWADMNRTFAQAELADAAMDALRHLEAIHSTRPLTLDDIEDATQIIAHLDPTGAEVQKAG